MVREVCVDDYYNVEHYDKSGIYKVTDSAGGNYFVLVLKRAGFAFYLTSGSDDHLIRSVLEDLKEIYLDNSSSDDIDRSDDRSYTNKTMNQRSTTIDEIIKVIAVSQKPELVKDLVKE